MTVSIQLETVADSISSLSVSGVTIKDIDSIPESAAMLCPVMFPDPDRWLSNVQVIRDSQGAGSWAKQHIEYTLTYLYLHSTVDNNLSFGIYAKMISKVVLIANAIITNEAVTGCAQLRLERIGDVIGVNDPAGNRYVGCEVAFRVMEFVN